MLKSFLPAVLLSASVERCFVSRMWDFLLFFVYRVTIFLNIRARIHCQIYLILTTALFTDSNTYVSLMPILFSTQKNKHEITKKKLPDNPKKGGLGSQEGCLTIVRQVFLALSGIFFGIIRHIFWDQQASFFGISHLFLGYKK